MTLTSAQAVRVGDVVTDHSGDARVVSTSPRASKKTLSKPQTSMRATIVGQDTAVESTRRGRLVSRCR